MLLLKSSPFVLSLALILAVPNQEQHHPSSGAIISVDEGEKFMVDKRRPLLLKVDHD